MHNMGLTAIVTGKHPVPFRTRKLSLLRIARYYGARARGKGGMLSSPSFHFILFLYFFMAAGWQQRAGIVFIEQNCLAKII